MPSSPRPISIHSYINDSETYKAITCEELLESARTHQPDDPDDEEIDGHDVVVFSRHEFALIEVFANALTVLPPAPTLTPPIQQESSL